jgi:hypothetical protein
MYKMFSSCICFSKYFLLKIHQNNFFLKKIIFDISISKWSENIKKILILSKEKNKKNYFLKMLLKRKNNKILWNSIKKIYKNCLPLTIF